MLGADHVDHSGGKPPEIIDGFVFILLQTFFPDSIHDTGDNTLIEFSPVTDRHGHIGDLAVTDIV